MKTFKMKSMQAAIVAGLGALGVSGAANAVHVNPDGLGQVLIFPYYTARAGQVTSVSLINTGSTTKAVKVRFLEGKNSREVLDFNLFLSPQDVWTGAVVATTDGARVVSNDNSCVTPSDLFTEARSDPNGLALNAFKNYQYTGAFLDSASFPTLDRTREGYFEVIEMGTVIDKQIQGYIKHGATGVPANCAALDALDPGSGNLTVFPNIGVFLAAPSGGLAGRASIINATTGANYTTDSTAVDAWSNAVNYSQAGFITPSLSGVAPSTSNVFTGGGVVSATWALGRDAMSAAITRDTLMNEFILDTGTASLTDWVITFPTKRDYVFSLGNGGVPAATSQPFSNNFPNSAAGSCDPYGIAVYNREEQTTSAAPNVILPSPRPPVSTPAGAQLCWEANVVAFGTSSLLGSTNTNNNVVASFVQGTSSPSGLSTPGSLTTPSLRATNGPNGWLLFSFNAVPTAPATAPNQRTVAPTAATLNGAALVSGVHVGLPVVGAMFHNFNRSGVVSQYGGVIPHRYTRQILP